MSEENKTNQNNKVSKDKEQKTSNNSSREVRKDSEAKWYVLHVFNGYEHVAQENLERVAEKFNLQDRIFEIVIPMEEVLEEKNGKKQIVEKKIMPSYILVKMIYGDDIWHTITGTRGITGFVGPKGRPLPLTEKEIVNMRLEKQEADLSIKKGDQVEVIEGSFNGYTGTVINSDIENEKCKVKVEMFGREVEVDFNLDQIRKI